MDEIPISAHLASIALKLEPALHALFWRVLSVLFVFVLSIPETWAVANYSSWAIFRVASGYVYPFLPECKANVREKAWGIVRRELRLLGEIRLVFRNGVNARIWTEVSNILKRLGASETRNELVEIYELVARPEIKAEAWYKFISCAIWAVLVTILFRFDRLDGPWALPRSHWLCWVVYIPGNYAWVHIAHMVWIITSQFKIIQIFQLRALLWLQRWALSWLFSINIVLEGVLATLVWAVLENSDRLVWVLGKCIASLLQQLCFDLIFTGFYRVWNGPFDTWDFSGRNFYLAIKALITIRSVFESRRSFPRRTNTDTNWTRQEQYSYNTLNECGGTIRLLVLHPRVPLAEIRCTLFEVSLSNIPSYEAISYTWGDANLRENIWVNGKALNVPKSSYTILSNRSSVWRPHLLWIDAVCINQQDEYEKDCQVPLMRDIYTKASIVSVCLQTSKAPEGAIPQLHEMTESFYASDVVFELAYLGLKKFSSELGVYRRYGKSIRKPRWIAFQALVRNPWFTRIWVVQEVALASSIRVFYGRSQFSWQHLVAAISTCIQHLSLASFLDVTRDEKDLLTRLLPPRSPIALDIMADFQQRVKDNKISFASAIYEANIFDATNPKDHVFGLHGFYREQIDTENSDDRIKPVYAKSVTKVYKDVAQYLLEQDHPLRLLSYAGIGFFDLQARQPVDKEGNSDTEKLPSWCPNWSKQPAVRILSYADPRRQENHYSAGGTMGKKPECSSEDGFASLILQGRILDTVVALGQTLTPVSAKANQASNSPSSTTEPPSTYRVEEVIDLIKVASHSLDLIDSTFKTKLHPRHQTPKEIFWRSLIGNRTSTKYPAPLSCALSFELWMLFGTTMLNLPGPLSPHAQMPLDAMKALDVEDSFGTLIPGCGLGRRMCITEKGFVGMVPPLTLERDDNGKREGDVVFLIRGAEVPFVLRPMGKDNGRKRFQLVGEAYIHGFMDGEVMKRDYRGVWEEEVEII
jgi:hypothetical protein